MRPKNLMKVRSKLPSCSIIWKRTSFWKLCPYCQFSRPYQGQDVDRSTPSEHQAEKVKILRVSLMHGLTPTLEWIPWKHQGTRADSRSTLRWGKCSSSAGMILLLPGIRSKQGKLHMKESGRPDLGWWALRLRNALLITTTSRLISNAVLRGCKRESCRLEIRCQIP